MIIKTNCDIKWDDEVVKFGIGLFETMLFRNNKLQFLEDHMNRLQSSSKKLDIGLKYFEAAKKDLKFIESTLSDEIIIRMTLTNEGYCIESRLNSYGSDKYTKGQNLIIYPYKRGESPLLKHKTTSYIQNIMAKKESVNLGFDDCIFIDYNENVLETSIANLYLKKNNQVVMPDLKSSLLEGIAQKNIESVLRYDCGFETSYRTIKLEDIYDYDEAYMSNSVMQLMPIRIIGQHEYPVNFELSTKVNLALDNYDVNEMNFEIINKFITEHFVDEEDIKFIILTGSSRRDGFSKDRDIDVFIIDSKSNKQQRKLVRHLGYDWDINIFSDELIKQMIRDKTSFLMKAIKESALVFGIESEFKIYKSLLEF